MGGKKIDGKCRRTAELSRGNPKLRRIFLTVLAFLMVAMSGCANESSADDSLIGTNVEYTVVEDADVPEKLMELIEQKKENEFRLTFTTNEYMYMAVGYGTQETDGYSISVRGVTADEDTVYVGTSLFGPAAGEKVAQQKTTPYIVLKAERRGKVVVYK